MNEKNFEDNFGKYSKITYSKKTSSKSKKKAISLNENAPMGIPVKIGFLGGLHEVGKNMTVIEFNDEMIIVDCGLSFPDESMPGVDLVIPDFTYIKKNADKLKGIFITHGHEDHIGGLVYLLENIKAPIYSTKLTLGLIKGKLKEAKLLERAKLIEIKPSARVKAGVFEVEAIHVNHSIPDALCFAIHTPAGTIVDTGDFKIDTTPIDGEMMDLTRLGILGREGVLALMSDSTNAERPGYTESERIVGASFARLFASAGNKRIIVATFSSNIHRVQQIVDVAISLGRKVALSGRSLENVVSVGTELGYLNVPDSCIIKIDQIKDYTSDQIVIITTGSQGEPMSALTRMARDDHRKVKIGPDDYVIISARPIPGNEKTVGSVINDLMSLGAQVIYENMYDVHVSGHACNEEQKIILGLVKPKYFIPVHGEVKQLKKHAELAKEMGMDDDHILVGSNGTQFSFFPDGKVFTDEIPSGKVYIDGLGVGDVGNTVLTERKKLSQDGVISIFAVVDLQFGYALTTPWMESRGFVFEQSSTELFDEATELVENIIDKYSKNKHHDLNQLTASIKNDVGRLMHNRTKRDPVIIPFIEEV